MSSEGRHPGDEPEPVRDAGLVLRPEASVLGDEALIPERNMIRPAPNHFSHELVVDEPFRLDRAERGGDPDGVLAAGTPVVVLVEGDERCRVVDGTGLYVDVRRTSLRRLPDA
jgi:hypothetical protein